MESISALQEFAVLLQNLGPWGMVFFLWWHGQRENRKWEERFQAVQRMYEDNVQLVKNYEKLAQDQQTLIVSNTQAITRLTAILEGSVKR